MPVTREPSTEAIASVTVPAGLVKLMTRAPGASSAIRSAILSATGTVRSPYSTPPAPTVSWPSSPSESGMCSSATRPAVPPTRIAEKTKSAPRTASSRLSATTTRGSPPPSAGRGSPSRTERITPARSGSVSYRVRVSTSLPASARYTSGTRKPPPPRIVSLMGRNVPHGTGTRSGRLSRSAPCRGVRREPGRRRPHAAPHRRCGPTGGAAPPRRPAGGRLPDGHGLPRHHLHRPRLGTGARHRVLGARHGLQPRRRRQHGHRPRPPRPAHLTGGRLR